MIQMKNFLRAILLLWILSGAAPPVEAQNEGAEKVKQPVEARIAPKHRTDPSFVVGDVIVTYTDGTTDSWTLKGNCMDPKVLRKTFRTGRDPSGIDELTGGQLGYTTIRLQD